MSPSPAQREQLVTARLQDIADDLFPENTHNTWTVLGFVHEADRTTVEVEPDPDDVGYPRFKLVLSFPGGAPPHCLAAYCAIGDRYRLLCSDPAWDRRAPAGV